MPITPRPPRINYTARDFASVLADLQAYVQATRPGDQTDFFETTLGALQLEAIAYAVDLLSYGQDIVAQEVFLATCRRLDSALRIARSVGAPTPSASSAEVVVTSAALPQTIVTYGAIVPAGAFISGANGLKYELVEELTIPPGSSVATLQLRQGTTITETFTPSKAPRQEFFTSRGIVEEAQWSVYVGDANDPTNRWEQVDNVAFETSATETYEVFFDGQGRLYVRFGDDVAGKIPNDVVSIVYRITDGASGNTAANTIRGSITASVIGLGTAVSITVENADGAATGGRDRSTVEALRQSIPAFLRTLDKVITITDYEEAVVARVPGVGLCYADNPQSSYRGNIVRVHVWDTEQFTFASTSPNQGTTSAVAYQRYVQSPSSRPYDVQTYLRPRTIATVHNVVITPSVALLDVDLGSIKYDTLNASADVHQGVVDAVVALFEESTGFLIRVSDIYARVLAVPGVRGFTIRRVVFEHIDFDDPTNGTVIEEFRTDQDVGGSVGGPFSPMNDIEIPGIANRLFYDDSYLYNDEITFNGEIDSTAVQAINLRSLVFELVAS